MWLKLLTQAIAGNLLPGQWRLALIRPDLIPRPELLLPFNSGDPALFAPLTTVRMFTAKGRSFEGMQEATPVRIESVHTRNGVGVAFEFRTADQENYCQVVLQFEPCEGPDDLSWE